MSLTRRTLMQAALGTAIVQAWSFANNSHPVIESPAHPAVLRLASREFVIPGETLQEKLDHMEAWGFDAIELDGANIAVRAPEIRKALQGRSITVGAVCAGYEGVLVHEDPAERHKAKQSIKNLIYSMAEFKPVGLIIVPAFIGQSVLYEQYAREALIHDLPELGAYAHQHDTTLLIEPLNRNETWYVRQLADAAAICKDVNHPGVRMMGDFFHMGIEEPCDYSAILASRHFIRNIHLASRQRFLPGQDDRDFRKGFRALHEIGYRDFCSLECFPQGDVVEEIPKSLEYIRQQWAEAAFV